MARQIRQATGQAATARPQLDELIRSKEEELKRLHDARRRWEEGPLAKALEKSGERRESFETLSGLETDRLYTPEHVAGPRLRARPRLPRRVSRSRAASSPRCTAAAPGRSASTRASARPKRRTSASSSCSPRASPASRPRSTFRRRWASTRTTSAPPAKSARSASRSTRSPTWRPSSTASRSTASRRR